MYNFNRDLIYFIKRDGTNENPYQDISEDVHVLYEKVFLEEVPVELFRVVAEVGNVALTEVDKLEYIVNETHYYVNYKQGIVYFHENRNGSLVNLQYKGQGVLLYPASRIYVDGDRGARDVVKTLRDLIIQGAEALDTVEQLTEIIERTEGLVEGVEIAVINANEAVDMVNQKIDEVNTSEAVRVSNENARITNESSRVSAELERANAELERQSKEDERIEAESVRLSNESTRVEAESRRSTSETARLEAEVERNTKEQSRKLAEDDRVLKESQRELAEYDRVEAEEERELNETDRINAESVRISEEGLRVSGELARVSAEQTRQYNELSRSDKEIVRESNEYARVLAENDRNANENTRLTSEEARQEKENIRVQNEDSRLIEESLRVLAENNRIAKEIDRVDKEQTRESNEAIRIANEESRISEESLRQSQELQRQTTFQTSITELNDVKQEAEAVITEMETVKTEVTQLATDIDELLEDTTFVGDFDIDTTYHKNNIVSYNGSSYIAKQEVIGVLPTNLVYWGILSVRGVDGTGAVSSVNGVAPDQDGNVLISAEQLGAERTSRKGVANGYVGLDANAKIPLSHIPDTLKQQVYIVENETARLALTDLVSGDKAYETDSRDSYIYDGSQWLLLADADWENVSLDWINILNKPTSTVEDIDLAVENIHNHTNIELLEKLRLVGGKLTYDGINIGSVDSVNGMTGVVTLNALSVGAYSRSEIDTLTAILTEELQSIETTLDNKIDNVESSLRTEVDGKISKSDKGVANGVARLNAQGKVVDANGNEVEGKVTSVNGAIGDITGLETVVGSNSKIANHESNNLLKHIEILDATPTTLDKRAILFIKKSVINDET